MRARLPTPRRSPRAGGTPTARRSAGVPPGGAGPARRAGGPGPRCREVAPPRSYGNGAGRAAAAGWRAAAGGTMSSLAEPPASRAPSRSPARSPALSPAPGPSRCGGERRRNASDAGGDLGTVQVSSPAARTHPAAPAACRRPAGAGLAWPPLAWPVPAWPGLAWLGRHVELRTSPCLCSGRQPGFTRPSVDSCWLNAALSRFKV